MSFLESLASLLFPPRCAFCGKPGVHGVCSECEKALPYCKTPLHERAEIGACLAPLKYEGIVREALLNYKFHGSQSRCNQSGQFHSASVPFIGSGPLPGRGSIPLFYNPRRGLSMKSPMEAVPEMGRISAFPLNFTKPTQFRKNLSVCSRGNCDRISPSWEERRLASCPEQGARCAGCCLWELCCCAWGQSGCFQPRAVPFLRVCPGGYWV